MVRYRRILCVLLALAFLMPYAGQAQALPFMEDPDAIDRVVKSILMLEVYDKNNELVATGSGFVAFDNYTIVTNYHVMDDALKIVANSDTGNRYMVTKVIAADPDKDIAILEFTSPTDLEPLTLDTETKPRRIDPVVAIGSPKGIAISASKGNISAVYEEFGVEYIQFTAPISPGSSGGALFNANGSVIGITSATYNDSQNMNLAVYIGEVVDLYKQGAGNKRTELKDFHYSPIAAPTNAPKPTPYTSPTPVPGPTATPKPVLEPPSNVKGSAGIEGITITWDSVPNATTYLVYRFTSAGVIALLGKTHETRYVDKSAQEPGVYRYKVICSDGDTMSYIPLEDLKVQSLYILSKELAVPRSFKAKAGKTAVTLTWSKAKNAREYTIYRSATENGLYTKLADVEAIKFIDNDVKLGNSYYYRIRCKDGTHVSETSKSIKAVMPNPTPTPKPSKTPKPTATPRREPKYPIGIGKRAYWDHSGGNIRFNPQVTNNSSFATVDGFTLTYYCSDVYGEKIKLYGFGDYYSSFTYEKTIKPGGTSYAGYVLLEGYSNIKYVHVAVTKFHIKYGWTVTIPEKEWIFSSLEID